MQPSLPRLRKDVITSYSIHYTKLYETIDSDEQELLWLRASFLEKLESVKTYAVSTVVIFGLQESIIRNQKYWTQKMESEYNA